MGKSKGFGLLPGYLSPVKKLGEVSITTSLKLHFSLA
jgi:hypothetical protein